MIAPTGMIGGGTKPGAFRADVGIGPYGGVWAWYLELNFGRKHEAEAVYFLSVLL